jgi:hypothetical protein
MKTFHTVLFAALTLAFTAQLHAEQGRTIPAQFHGTWTWNENGFHPENGEQPLTISAKEITAHETSGQVTRTIEISADGRTCTVSVDAACEGMEGKEKLTLILSSDGRRLALKQGNTNTCGFGAGDYYRAR